MDVAPVLVEGMDIHHQWVLQLRGCWSCCGLQIPAKIDVAPVLLNQVLNQADLQKVVVGVEPCHQVGQCSRSEPWPENWENTHSNDQQTQINNLYNH
jgi:hypothetical protein